MASIFSDIDFSIFWLESPYFDEFYTDAAPTRQLIEYTERLFGVSLPKSYVELIKSRNGGKPVKDTFIKSGLEFQIEGIFALGNKKRSSLNGEFSNEFWAAEWGYPLIGIYFADSPSGGHDLFAFDYRACGPHGEPAVVNVDQEQDYKIQLLAPNFETFIRGLVPEPTDIS